MQVSGFADIGLLTPLRRLYPLPVRQASTLPSASFRFHLAVDTLAVRLTVPLTGPVDDFHLQVIQLPPQQLNSASNGAARHAWRTNKKSPEISLRASACFFLQPRADRLGPPGAYTLMVRRPGGRF